MCLAAAWHFGCTFQVSALKIGPAVPWPLGSASAPVSVTILAGSTSPTSAWVTQALPNPSSRALCSFWGKLIAPHGVQLRPTSAAATLLGMCRNIRPLFNFEPPATDEE